MGQRKNMGKAGYDISSTKMGTIISSKQMVNDAYVGNGYGLWITY